MIQFHLTAPHNINPVIIDLDDDSSSEESNESKESSDDYSSML
jgi:hypothetical protein